MDFSVVFFRFGTSETNLELYEEAVLLFQIRPIFGGFAALVIFMLISWGAFEMRYSNQILPPVH